MMLALSSTLATGCGSDPSPEVEVGPDGTPDPVLVTGREVYVDRCSSCHDSDGSGTGNGPRLNRGRLLEAYAGSREVAAVVTEGRNRMPGFGSLLTTSEIDAVLRYINEIL